MGKEEGNDGRICGERQGRGGGPRLLLKQRPIRGCPGRVGRPGRLQTDSGGHLIYLNNGCLGSSVNALGGVAGAARVAYLVSVAIFVAQAELRERKALHVLRSINQQKRRTYALKARPGAARIGAPPCSW